MSSGGSRAEAGLLYDARWQMFSAQRAILAVSVSATRSAAVVQSNLDNIYINECDCAPEKLYKNRQLVGFSLQAIDC